ncbi:MAG: MmcQ/YjbR family DNA-binding protein [Clostridia bacterium]|nr:MmcQ/YjbR family DNA-binding protein [Clostridia bacterium]
MDRESLIEYIQEEFNIDGERLWLNFPNYLVFRNSKNKKWFAAVMDVEKSALGLEGSGKADIVNLKCDNILIGSLLHNNGYLPAYHMNKNNWISVMLDGSVSDDELKDLIHLSFDIIDRKKCH